MTTIAQGLVRGRSHLIIAAALAIGGTLVVRIEDRTLNREAGKPIPVHAVAPPVRLDLPAARPAPATAATEIRRPAPVAVTGAPPPASPLPAQTTRPSAARPAALVQLGAYDSVAVAEERWRDVTRADPSLAPLGHRVETVSAGGGTMHRLLVEAPSIQAARDTCGRVRRAGRDCFVR